MPTNYLMFAKETKENKETATPIKILPRVSELVFRKLGLEYKTVFYTLYKVKAVTICNKTRQKTPSS